MFFSIHFPTNYPHFPTNYPHFKSTGFGKNFLLMCYFSCFVVSGTTTWEASMIFRFISSNAFDVFNFISLRAFPYSPNISSWSHSSSFGNEKIPNDFFFRIYKLHLMWLFSQLRKKLAIFNVVWDTLLCVQDIWNQKWLS